MKVSEKSLELNVGTEVLNLMRWAWGRPKTYLRGLTQLEEKRQGVDFFAELDPASRLFAFQFKAPKGRLDGYPYRYTLVREQHAVLYKLARRFPGSAFYVLPFYVTVAKLQQYVPTLMRDTWLMPIDQMPTKKVFGTAKSKTARCQAGRASIKPEHDLAPLGDLSPQAFVGVPPDAFSDWYRHYRDVRTVADRHRNPWIARGLRVAVVLP